MEDNNEQGLAPETSEAPEQEAPPMDLLDLIATDASPSDVSDHLKTILYAKSAEKIDALKPLVAQSMFDAEVEQETEEETDGE